MFTFFNSCAGLLFVLQSITGTAHANVLVNRVPQGQAAPLSACSYAVGVIEFCASVSPGFLSLAPSSQAPCLCYSSTAWAPNLFDGAVATCADFASTAAPTDYTAIEAFADFCSSVGNVENAPASAAATPTLGTGTITASASSGGAFPSDCKVVLSALESCTSVSPGFLNLAPSSQAPCLCYSSTVWKPDLFDGAVATCAEFYSTADPSGYSTIEDFAGFCSSVGNVESSGAASSTAALTPGAGTGLSGATMPTITQPPTTTAPATSSPTHSSIGDAGPGINLRSMILSIVATMLVFLWL